MGRGKRPTDSLSRMRGCILGDQIRRLEFRRKVFWPARDQDPGGLWSLASKRLEGDFAEGVTSATESLETSLLKRSKLKMVLFEEG